MEDIKLDIVDKVLVITLDRPPVNTLLLDTYAALAKTFDAAGMRTNSQGEKFTLYSLRHFYAVMGLRGGIGIYDIARNMGTSVQMIQSYYGRQATPISMATTLGGMPAVKKKKKDRGEETPVP